MTKSDIETGLALLDKRIRDAELGAEMFVSEAAAQHCARVYRALCERRAQLRKAWSLAAMVRADEVSGVRRIRNTDCVDTVREKRRSA